jgi:hypothetical protein
MEFVNIYILRYYGDILPLQELLKPFPRTQTAVVPAAISTVDTGLASLPIIFMDHSLS